MFLRNVGSLSRNTRGNIPEDRTLHNIVLFTQRVESVIDVTVPLLLMECP
jgi:hypothetical protein